MTTSVDYYGHDCLVTARLVGSFDLTVTCRTTGSVAPPGTRVQISVVGPGLIFADRPDAAG